MKINKFNESNESDFDITYIENCFVDFLYENKNRYNFDNINNKWSIEIFLPKGESYLEHYYKNVRTLDTMIKHNEAITDIYKDIMVSIDKVKLKYPTIRFEIIINWFKALNYHYAESITLILSPRF